MIIIHGICQIDLKIISDLFVNIDYPFLFLLHREFLSEQKHRLKVILFGTYSCLSKNYSLFLFWKFLLS